MDLSPKVRREFDIIYGDLVKSYYDYQNGLIYFIENNKYISKLKEIIESDLERYPVYNVLLDENLLIEALEIDTLRSVKNIFVSIIVTPPIFRTFWQICYNFAFL